MPRARSVLVSLFSTRFALAPVPREARAADDPVAQPAIGRARLQDVPADSKDPLFPIGSGLTCSRGR